MERRQERKVHKERDAENGEFDDKEKFVTNAYKEKMAEMRAQEEEEKKQDMMEDIMDVTKQKDMSGFYKHFLNRQTAQRGNIRQRKESSSSEEEGGSDDNEPLDSLVEPKEEIPISELRTEIKTEKIEIKEENPDADSDFMDDDSDDENKVKTEPGADGVKADPDQEVQEEKETLEEFKARLKKKKERRLDIYRSKHTPETLEPYRERYLERKEKRRTEGKYV